MHRSFDKEAVAPLLRAPGGQGGRVDEACTDIDSPFNACMYRDHCRSMQAALAQNAQVDGEPWAWRWRSVFPDWRVTMDGEFAQMMRDAGGHTVEPLYLHAERARVPELTFGQRAVATELLRCCEAWEPGVRVMGNVQARDVADLLRHLLNTTPSQPEDADHE